MKNSIEIGDIVRLKSGGPWMTVSDVQTDSGAQLYTCVWFPSVDSDAASEENFFECTLQVSAAV